MNLFKKIPLVLDALLRFRVDYLKNEKLKRWDLSVPFKRVRMVCWFCCVTKGKQLKIKYFNLATQQNKHALRTLFNGTGTSVSLTISFLGQSMLILGRAARKNEKTQNWAPLMHRTHYIHCIYKQDRHCRYRRPEYICNYVKIMS